jgi:hypothetical protein
MAFSDPQSVTISATPYSLPRVSTGDDSSEYKYADGSIIETVSSQYGKRTRRQFKIAHSKVAVDPLVPTQNAPYSMSFYIVADTPVVGYTVAEQKAVIDGFIAQLNASSGALITAWLGGQN